MGPCASRVSGFATRIPGPGRDLLATFGCHKATDRAVSPEGAQHQTTEKSFEVGFGGVSAAALFARRCSRRIIEARGFIFGSKQHFNTLQGRYGRFFRFFANGPTEGQYSILYDTYCLMLCGPTNEIILQSPRSPGEWDAYFDLRWRILRKPRGQPRGK